MFHAHDNTRRFMAMSLHPNAGTQNPRQWGSSACTGRCLAAWKVRAFRSHITVRVCVCVCVCVCVYGVCMRTDTYMCKYICIHVQAETRADLQECTHARMWLNRYIRRIKYVYMMHNRRQAYVQIPTCLHAHTNTMSLSYHTGTWTRVVQPACVYTCMHITHMHIHIHMHVPNIHIGMPIGMHI